MPTALRLDSVLWDTSLPPPPRQAAPLRHLYETDVRPLPRHRQPDPRLPPRLRRPAANAPGSSPMRWTSRASRERSRISPAERARGPGAARRARRRPRGPRPRQVQRPGGALGSPAGVRAASAREDLWLVLAGDGPARPALEEFARDEGLSRVRFPGYIPYPELPALYAAADLFVHAAREERWGVSVQEALACGLPVVASSRVGAGYDLIEVGGNGFVYPAGRRRDAGAADRRGAGPRTLSGSASAARAILARWDYAATWRHLLDAAAAGGGELDMSRVAPSKDSMPAHPARRRLPGPRRAPGCASRSCTRGSRGRRRRCDLGLSIRSPPRTCSPTGNLLRARAGSSRSPARAPACRTTARGAPRAHLGAPRRARRAADPEAVDVHPAATATGRCRRAPLDPRYGYTGS